MAVDPDNLSPYYKRLFTPSVQSDARTKLDRIHSCFIGGIIGLGYSVGRNMQFNRPYMAGIQVHAVSLVAGLIGGELVRLFLQKRREERERRLYYYVLLHPEDFPEPKRVKFANEFQEWQAMR